MLSRTARHLTVAAVGSLALVVPVSGSALAATAAGPTAVSAAPAERAGGCVSRPEYQKIRKGMPKAKVHKIFGTAGIKVDKIGANEVRGYRVCTSKKGAVALVFTNGKLASKQARFK